MSPPAQVSRGVRALRRVLREQAFDLRGLDLAGFRRWLDQHLARWQHDPVFAQRTRIRDLRRAHPHLQTAEQEYRRIDAADAASPQHPRLLRLEQELIDAGKAISGLTGALKRKAPEKHPEMRRKRDAFRARRQELENEQSAVIRSSPERQALLRATAELQQLRSTIGLDREEAWLAKLLKERGRRSGRSGEAFEQSAVKLARSDIVPDLLRRSRGDALHRVALLRGVTLGAARIEFDQLLVRRPRRSGRPVEVLAVVEVKRNVNDVAHGFRRRQENLAWLTGDSAHYRPQAYRTRHFRSGHFDREAVHQHEGEPLPFTRRSFRLFRRDPDAKLFLNRLYFVTRVGPVWGVSTVALSRISFRVATDERWNPDSESYLRRLMRWCRSLVEPVETADVFRLYAAATRRARQVLLVDR